MKKFRDENEIKYSIEKDFPVPERLSPESMEASLKGDNKLSTTGRSAATHSKSKKNSDNEVYARGPGLWTIGAAAAAIAIIGGGMFFFGGSGSDLDTQPAEPIQSESKLPADSNLSDYEQKLAARPNLTITVEGYERTGKDFHEIKIEDLNDGEDITVHLKVGDSNGQIKVGDSNGQIDGVDIWGGTYYIFFDGYSALNLTADETYNKQYVQFINKMGSGEFTKTDDGYVAEYTFSFDDLNEISRKEKTFSIAAIACVDLDDEHASDSLYYDILYNTAYEEQNKISYLNELYSDASPSKQGTISFKRHYDGMLRKAGYYHYREEIPENNNMYFRDLDIIENPDDGKVYLSYYRSGKKDPEYLFEGAYYMFVFVNDEFVPIVVKPGDDTYDDVVSYQTLIDFTDDRGNDRCFTASLGDISDIRGVDVITIPVTPYPYSGDYGTIFGKAIGDID